MTESEALYDANAIDFDSIRDIVDIVGKSVSAWSAQVLSVGVRLELFECLGKGPKTIDE